MLTSVWKVKIKDVRRVEGKDSGWVSREARQTVREYAARTAIVTEMWEMKRFYYFIIFFFLNFTTLCTKHNVM